MDYSTLRPTVTYVSFLRRFAIEVATEFDLGTNCSAYRVMSAFNTFLESDAGTGHWFTPSII